MLNSQLECKRCPGNIDFYYKEKTKVLTNSAGEDVERLIIEKSSYHCCVCHKSICAQPE